MDIRFRRWNKLSLSDLIRIIGSAPRGLIFHRHGRLAYKYERGGNNHRSVGRRPTRMSRLRVAVLALTLSFCYGAAAVPQASLESSTTTSTTATSAEDISVGAPTLTLSTSIASPTVPLSNTLPSQAPLPPAQAWCRSRIFCAGTVRFQSIWSRFDADYRCLESQLLQTVNIAQAYSDPKTFVDKPTKKEMVMN